MLIRIIIPLFAFSAVLVLHLFSYVYKTSEFLTGHDPTIDINYWSMYTASYNQTAGFSLALGAFFFSYAALKLIQYRKIGVRDIVKGIAITGILFLMLTFVFGFYTVSIEEFYISKFGWVFLVIKKAIILMVTLISIIPGYIYILVKTWKKSDAL